MNDGFMTRSRPEPKAPDGSSRGRVTVLFFWTCLLLARLEGHAVSQIYSQLSQVEGEPWKLVLTLDTGLLDGTATDLEAPQKSRDWLFSLSEEKHHLLRERARKLVQEHFAFEQAEVRLRFPDYAEVPYAFPELLNGGAYLRVQIQPDGKEPLKLRYHFPEVPLLIVQYEGEHRQVLSGERRDFIRGGESEFSFFSALRIGFGHVLPNGWDHVLLMAALCLGARTWRQVFSLSLVFTIAHSLTLAAAVAGVVPTGGKATEILIALSIALAAGAALRTEEKFALQTWLALGTGLLHGLGFAGALASYLEGSAHFFPMLLAMNLGIEVAQALVVVVTCVLLRRLPRLILVIVLILISVGMVLQRI